MVLDDDRKKVSFACGKSLAVFIEFKCDFGRLFQLLASKRTNKLKILNERVFSNATIAYYYTETESRYRQHVQTYS